MYLPIIKNKEKGFSLIELLVVISIIGLLSTIFLANYNAARERARDSQRKSDLRTLQTALRMYYNDHNLYPATAAWPACDSAWTYGTTIYIQTFPCDPSTHTSYAYIQTEAGANYTLRTCLENASDDKCGDFDIPGCDGCSYSVMP